MKNVHIPETHRLHYIWFLRFYVYFLYTLQDPENSWIRINADMEKKQWPKENFCAGSLITEAKPIKWIDIQSAFYLIGIGTIFGVFILGSEFIFSKCSSEKNSKCNTSFCSKVSEWIWSLIWIFEYWCRWIFHVWCQWIQRLMSVNSNADVDGFYGWCQWIQMQISVNSTVKCQWIQRLVSVNSALSISELKCLFRWIQRWMFVKSNEMQAQSISFWRINVNICDIFCYIL